MRALRMAGMTGTLEFEQCVPRFRILGSQSEESNVKVQKVVLRVSRKLTQIAPPQFAVSGMPRPTPRLPS